MAQIFTYSATLKIDGTLQSPEGEVPKFDGLPAVIRPLAISRWESFCRCETAAITRPTQPCPFCCAPLTYISSDRFRETRYGYGMLRHVGSPVAYTIGPHGLHACSTCGFWFVEETGTGMFAESYYDLTLALLRDLPSNDPEVPIIELAKHLARYRADVYTLPPRRFEELVAQIYRDLGYEVQLTTQTRDGGYDLVLLERGGGSAADRQTIVECKRYAGDRRITVGVVRHLIGVQLTLGIRHAKLVASTHFTAPAHHTAALLSKGTSGYELELVDLSELTRLLGVYANDEVPLELDPRFPKTRRDAGLF